MTTGQEHRIEPLELSQDDRSAEPFAPAPQPRVQQPEDWPELVPEAPVGQAPDPQAPLHVEAMPEPVETPEPTFQVEPESAPEPSLRAAPVEDPEPMVPAEVAAAPEPIQSTIPRQDRPRVALMGEFSAGKSTLSNLLLGRSAVPVNVTATQLPPVWLSYGDEAPFTVDLNGDEHPLNLEDLEAVSVQGTNHIRIFHQAERLQDFDLIDMPGISDPNMAADVWQRVIHNANVVIWCSHATQAWRQSEAAVWSTMPEELYQRSILLLTRMDRILSDRDRTRVIKRVESETKGLFRQVLPVSLIKALESEPGADAWAESGADDLLALLGELVDEVTEGGTPRVRSRRITRTTAAGDVEVVDEETAPREEAPRAKPARIVMPTRVRPRPLQG